MTTQLDNSTQGEVRPRKPYRSPELQIYGNIRSITTNIAMSGNKDGIGPMAKTD